MSPPHPTPRLKAEFEKRVDPSNKEQMSLLEEMVRRRRTRSASCASTTRETRAPKRRSLPPFPPCVAH